MSGSSRSSRPVDTGGPSRTTSRTSASSSGRAAPSRSTASITASGRPAAVDEHLAELGRRPARPPPPSSTSFDGW